MVVGFREGDTGSSRYPVRRSRLGVKFKGRVLRPNLDTLNEDEGAAFLQEYAERVGTTLLPVRRLFLMATT